ncbi:MAG: hypothetical protein ABSB49_22400 [Polyangia bacterium]
MPWLAAGGALAYSPESPPQRDYYFKYGFVLRGVLSEHAVPQRPYFFGACFKEDAARVLTFWERSRSGKVERVALRLGRVQVDGVAAPVAVYLTETVLNEPVYVLVQHGSYQIVKVADQPLLADGEVVLYRGVQKAKQFRLLCLRDLNASRRQIWQRYLAVQAHVLSDATRSFNSIHDRAARSETTHIRDRSFMTDHIARQHQLDVVNPGFARALWRGTHESFSLARWVAERKFGPSYVVAKAPLDNIRITSFFAGEQEARIIDPRRVEVLETRGCRVIPVP